GNERAPRNTRAILGRAREFVAAVCRGAPADDGRRGPNRPAGTLEGTRQHHDRCRVCRPRRDVPDVGAGALRGAPRRGTRTLAPPGHDIAAAWRRTTAGVMTKTNDPSARTAAPESASGSHVPVLLDAVLAALAPRD